MELLESGAATLGIPLGARQVGQFQRYYRELVEWNARVNLTSVTGWAEVQTRHFLDSLTVSLAIESELLHSGRALDVGAGAGLPGMPLKIAFPGLKLTLIDATAKKAAFLQHLAGALGLDGVEVVTGRAEALAHASEMREGFDIVASRAVARLSVLAELTLPFCSVGGTVVAQKKAGIDQEIEEARKAIELMGGEIEEVRRIDLPELAEPRSLVVMRKVSWTPANYPRRPGIPKKRPL